jgi:hypothetical protein
VPIKLITFCDGAEPSPVSDGLKRIVVKGMYYKIYHGIQSMAANILAFGSQKLNALLAWKLEDFTEYSKTSLTSRMCW